jgi:hypothetical protein
VIEKMYKTIKNLGEPPPVKRCVSPSGVGGHGLSGSGYPLFPPPFRTAEPLLSLSRFHVFKSKPIEKSIPKEKPVSQLP